MYRRVVGLLILTFCFACVSKGKYKALDQKYKDATATIKKRDARIKSLEEEIRDREDEIANLKEEKATLQAELAAAKEQRTKLEGELASVVKDRAKLKESTAALKKALAQAAEREDQAKARLNQLRVLLARFKKLIDAGKLKVKIANGRMILELPSDVLFASGRAKLNDEGDAAIRDVAKVLATFRDRQFQIEGHTDNVPIKTSRFPSNWDLASARAITVVKTMVDAGVQPATVSAAGYGEYRPAYTNESDEGRAGNRRIEIVLVPDLSQLPGFDELNKAMDKK
jgi:chemotaxis protein MotB